MKARRLQAAGLPGGGPSRRRALWARRVQAAGLESPALRTLSRGAQAAGLDILRSKSRGLSRGGQAVTPCQGIHLRLSRGT